MDTCLIKEPTSNYLLNTKIFHLVVTFDFQKKLWRESWRRVLPVPHYLEVSQECENQFH